MTRMNEGMIVRGPDGQAMMVRDGRIMRDGMLPMDRAPSADGINRPGMQGGMNMGANGGMRPEIGRLGPDGTMVRGPGPMPYGQPQPYGPQGGGFSQPAGPGYVLHQTPAQQHQTMQTQRTAPRAGSVDEMPMLSGQMNLQDEMGEMVHGSGPGRRQSMPPQMNMMNGVGPGPQPGPGPGPGMVMGSRRSMMVHQRPFPLGLGIVRMLQMSQEMSDMQGVGLFVIASGL
jgi:hypothetical protein